MLYIDQDYNITLTRGDTGFFFVSLRYKNGKKYAPQEGDHLRFALSKNWNKDIILIKEIPIDTCILELTPQETKELDFKTYKYDIEFTDDEGHVSTVLLGKFTIDKEVY